MLETTPWLLIWWNESHYFEKYKDIFTDNKIILPESINKPVFIYTNFVYLL